MDNSVSLLATVIFFVIIGLGGLAVLWGTILRNRWGINVYPVFCPRCQTPAPIMRETRSIEQRLWGGWTCPTCGVGVDKWGRQVSAAGPPNVVKPEANLLRAFRRRAIRWAPVCFGTFMVLDWIGIMGSGFPSGWGQALLQVCVNLIWTAIYIAIFYWGAGYIIGLFVPPKTGSGGQPPSGSGPPSSGAAPPSIKN